METSEEQGTACVIRMNVTFDLPSQYAACFHFGII